MSWTEAAQAAKAMLPEYARERLEPSKGGLYCCPICGSGHGAKGTGAFGIFSGGTKWKCHSCGETGDIFDLHEKLTGKRGKDVWQEIFSLYRIEYTPGGAPAARDVFPDPEDFTAYYKKAAACLMLTDYHKRRGISDETARRFMLGYDPAWKPPTKPDAPETPRLIIPVSKTGYVARRTDGGEDYAKQKTGTGCWTFNVKALRTARKPVFVVEGEFDAISICEVGGEAVTIGSASWTDTFLRLLDQQRPAQPLVLALDNDQRGQDAAGKLEAGLRSRGLSFYRCNPYGTAKDANEALTTDREAFTAAIRQAEAAAAPVDDLDAFLDKVKSKAYEPLPTGIHDIDHALCGGFFRQSIVLLGAAPGMGKTVMAQWLAERMAAAGAGVLYFALEMSPEQMLARSLSRRIWKTTGRDLSALDILQYYRLSDDQKNLVGDAIKAHRQELGKRLRYVNQSAELDAIIATMDAEAARAKDAGEPAPLVIIDYLHLVRGKDREDDIGTLKRAMKTFKDFAVQHDTMVLVITANSRAANQKGDAGLESGRDTSALEYSADIHMGIEYTAIEEDRQNAEGKPYTPKQLEGMKKHAEREGRAIPFICREISLTVNKHRFAASGRRARLLFDGKHSVFDQVATAEAFGDWKPITPELEAALSLPETPGECLRRLRGAKGLTPGVLGKKLGVSAAFVSGLEKGERDADPEQREAIAAALGVEVSAIWK